MKKQYKIIGVIILFVIVLNVLQSSYSYEISDLEENSVLIGNDLHKGYIGPNKTIKSALDYYLETNDEKPIKLYKYNGKTINDELSWSVLNEDNIYSKLTELEVNELEIRRYVHNVKNKLDQMLEDELSALSSFKYNDLYYIFAKELEKKGIYSTKKLSGYLVYKDKKLVNYNFDINNIRYDNYNDNILEVINISDFGAVGDGVTDDTLAIRKAIDYLNINGGKLLFEKNKTYLVSLQDENINISNPNTVVSTFTINSGNKIVIDLNGSTIKHTPNNILHFRIMYIHNSHDVTIQNGSIIGDRLEHDFSTQYKDNTGTYYAFGNCITINSHLYDNFMNVYLKDLKVSYATGDGIGISLMQSSNGEEKGKYGNGLVILDNVESFKNRRQGLSIISSDKVILKNFKAYNIGDILEDDKTGVLYAGTDYTNSGFEFPANDLGIDPKSGIDIEPVYTWQVNDTIVMDNVELKNNDGYSLVTGKEEYTNKIYIYKSKLMDKVYTWNSLIYDTIFENSCSRDVSQFYKTNIYNSEFINPTLYINEDSTINNAILSNLLEKNNSIININNGAFNNSLIENSTIYFNDTNKKNGYNNQYNNVDATIQTNSYLDTDSLFNNSKLIFTSEVPNVKAESNISNLNIYNSSIDINSIESSINFDKVYMNKVIINNFSSNDSLYITNHKYLDSTLNDVKFYGNGENNRCNCQIQRTNFCLLNWCYNSFIFENSNIKNIYSDTYLPLTLTNSKLEIENIDDNMFLNKESICNNSEIIINNNLYSANVLNEYKDINNCTINLNNYNDSTLLNISNKVLNKDYYVNYYGNNILNS